MTRHRSGVSVVVACLSGLLFACAAFASADPQSVTLHDILTQQTQLRAQLTSGKGAFKGLSKSERNQLLEKQGELMSLLQGVNTLDELRPDQRTAVFNNLEWIKAAVTKAEDERMVCEYVRTVGSNVPKSVCMTAREQREHRDNARKSLEQATICVEACAGG